MRQREAHLVFGFADAGKDDALAGNAGGQGTAELAFRNDIGAGAKAGQKPDHRLVGIGFDGIEDRRPPVGECRREAPETTVDRAA